MSEGIKEFLSSKTERVVESLSQRSLKLNYAIYLLYQDDNYWKMRVENILNIKLPPGLDQFNDIGGWYNFYNKIYNREKDELLSDDKLLDLLNKSIQKGDQSAVDILRLAEINNKVIFLTGIEEVDVMIMLNIDSLDEVMALSNVSKLAKNILDKPKIFPFPLIKEKYHLYSGCINSMEDLVILKKELDKAVPEISVI